jgi:hypothetical protein
VQDAFGNLARCYQNCEAGQYGFGSSCFNCVRGKYSSSGGASACSLCLNGKYADRVKSSTCKVCPSNSASSSDKSTCFCDPGTQRSTDNSGNLISCTKCDAGKAGDGNNCGEIDLYFRASRALRIRSRTL